MKNRQESQADFLKKTSKSFKKNTIDISIHYIVLMEFLKQDVGLNVAFVEK